jgi:hypothetical protein
MNFLINKEKKVFRQKPFIPLVLMPKGGGKSPEGCILKQFKCGMGTGLRQSPSRSLGHLIQGFKLRFIHEKAPSIDQLVKASCGRLKKNLIRVKKKAGVDIGIRSASIYSLA